MSTMFSTLNKSKKEISFQIDNIDLAYVNSIRRIILSEIPNVGFAFDPLTDNNPDMTIHENKTSLHNEFLAHRLSLIPICMSENEVYNFDPSKYTFRLKKANRGTDIINVTSKDIEILDEEGNKYSESIHKRFFPSDDITNDHILISRLKPNHYNIDHGEEVDITCKASRDIAMKHARWCPVSKAHFENALDPDEVEAGLKAKIQEIEKERGSSMSHEEKELFKKRFHTLNAYRFFKKNKFDEPCSFIFTIKSICALHPEYLFFKAIRILKDKIKLFRDHLKDRHSSVVIQPMGDVPNYYQIVIAEENYTLVNVLQSQIYNHCIRDKKLDFGLTYIGYFEPHPLDRKMAIKVRFNKDVDLVEFFETTCSKMMEDLDSITQNWLAFTSFGKEVQEVQEFLTM